jgi:hypothetical protein
MYICTCTVQFSVSAFEQLQNLLASTRLRKLHSTAATARRRVLHGRGHAVFLCVILCGGPFSQTRATSTAGESISIPLPTGAEGELRGPPDLAPDWSQTFATTVHRGRISAVCRKA